MPPRIRLCRTCGEPVVWREDNSNRTDPKWVMLETSLEDPTRPEHFATEGVYQGRGKLVSRFGKQPKTMIPHVCGGPYCYSRRENSAQNQTPNWKDWL